MNQAVVVLSLSPPNNPGELWHFAALKIEDGVTPKFICFSGFDGYIGEELCNNKFRIEKFIQNAAVFVYDIKKTDYLLGKYLQLNTDQLYIDIRELMAMFYPTVSQNTLHEFSAAIGINIRIRSRSSALRDVRAAWEVVKLCWTKGMNSELGYVLKTEEYVKGLSSEAFIRELKREIVRKYPDRPIRTELLPRETEKNLFETKADPQTDIPVSLEWAVNCFRADGLLAKNLPGFEDREIQVAMAKEIINGFTKSKDIVIEAGTGTGKSIAYLIPALWWSKKTSQKVIVATHTITLQEQLFSKDLPLLERILPFKFSTALLKGKSNYLCLKSITQDSAMVKQLSPEERLFHAGLLSWITETQTGDFRELPNIQNAGVAWKKYGADNPLCQPSDCQYVSRCFLFKARKLAEEADLIVVNHSLLLADIKTNNKILPDYSNLIIDEAHNIYQTALKQLGFEISLDQVLKMMDHLYGGRGSLLTSLKRGQPLWSEIFPYANWTGFVKCLEEIPLRSNAVSDQIKELFDMFKGMLQGRSTLLLDQEKLGESVYEVFMLVIENIIVRTNELSGVLDKLLSYLSFESEQLESIKYDIVRSRSDLVQLINGFELILNKEEEYRVTYLEKSNTVYLKNTLIDIAPILNKKIFSKNNCTILTSATLSVADDFSYVTKELGVENYQGLKLDSPFDYQEQMLFCIVNDLPINQSTEEVLAEKTASFIKKIADILKGGILVLFTSHRYLRTVQHFLQQELQNDEITILSQGIDGTREVLLQKFITNTNSILLGTSSFWEGIDVAGESLRCVIMVRLPFWPPDTPVLETKARLLESQGRDPFYELSLPEAIIRFKQGFGRLIRAKSDKGVVIILDDRIIKKKYGVHFLKALPISSYFKGSSIDVIKKIKNSKIIQ